MHFIRFFKVGCHLCQNFSGRYPHIYRESEPFIHLIFNFIRTFHRRCEPVCDFCKIHVTFIHTDLFYMCRVSTQEIHKSPAVFAVHLVIRRITFQIRTLTKGIRNRFPCTNAIFFCRNGFCQNDTVAGLLVAANDRRYRPDIHFRSIL